MSRRTTVSTPEDLISRPEAARILGIGVAAVSRMMANGRLPYVRVGDCQPKIARADVEALAARSRYRPDAH